MSMLRYLRCCSLLVMLLPSRMLAQAGSDSIRQSLSDAWWTGPVAAAGAGTLPPSHLLFEPYFYDVRTPHTNSLGSSAYIVYGLADRIALGFIPVIGYNKQSSSSSDGKSSSRVGLGDVSLLAQYRLTQFHEGSWIPTISALVEETFPTGKYDRLGDRPSDGLGQGAYTTTLSIYSQTYFWMPNGRILRTRLDLSQAFSNAAAVRDVSVYGTAAGFRGHAKPGGSFFADASVEYSLTTRWVLALDVNYGQRAGTRVSGYDVLNSVDGQSSQGFTMSSGWSDAIGFIPAVEYNWTPNLGVIFGVRRIMPGRNSSGSVTPVMAINFVR
ncbi:MAG TPA: hypothetical protein VN650_03170 [Gemmatimonadaceae bacterium]|nr:hypothetical protein [Gemmatimonadaceae bacterium]